MNSFLNSFVGDVMLQQEDNKKIQSDKNINYTILNVNPDKICDNIFNDIYDNFTQSSADEQLKESILKHGLLENLVVASNECNYSNDYNKEKYDYRVISGHRRLHAIKKILKENPQEAKRFITIPVKVETYSSKEEELLALNSYNLHSRTLSAEDKLRILSEIKIKLESMIGDKEPDEKQKTIRAELKKYDNVFNGMAAATKRRYMAISVNSNPKITELINDGFTIHQLAKISNFPGLNFNPFLSLLNEERYKDLEPILKNTGDLQDEILKAVIFLKSNGFWQNETNIKNWRNYIINEFVTPVHLCLVTTKSNCSAYNIATAAKDKENTIAKIKHQISNINNLTKKFREGYETGDLYIFNREKSESKSIVDKFETDFKKLESKEDMIKVLKSVIKQASNLDVITSEKAVEIMNLL